MDEYQTLDVCQEDAEHVRAVLENHGSIVFPLNISEGTCFNFCITKKFEYIGKCWNGGSPFGRVYVAIQGIGANHFAPEETHEGYFESKFGTRMFGPAEAKGLADFWRMIWKI